MGLVVAAVCLGGCTDGSVVAALEVHNRTVDRLEYTAADGERLVIPACGSAFDATFRIDSVQVRAEEGYVRGFGAAAPELTGRHVFVVEVASASESGVPVLGLPPADLPPCEGHAEAQPGT